MFGKRKSYCPLCCCRYKDTNQLTKCTGTLTGESQIKIHCLQHFSEKLQDFKTF